MKKKVYLAIVLVLVFVSGYTLGAAHKRQRVRVIKAVPRQARIVPAARVVGENGYLMGWGIEDQDGNTLCSDPYVWTSTREIECEVQDE